jgi:hypothetical protein
VRGASFALKDTVVPLHRGAGGFPPPPPDRPRSFLLRSLSSSPPGPSRPLCPLNSTWQLTLRSTVVLLPVRCLCGARLPLLLLQLALLLLRGAAALPDRLLDCLPSIRIHRWQTAVETCGGLWRLVRKPWSWLSRKQPQPQLQLQVRLRRFRRRRLTGQQALLQPAVGPHPVGWLGCGTWRRRCHASRVGAEGEQEGRRL